MNGFTRLNFGALLPPERANVSTPIVLITEELSPAGIAQLESDFEIRHADGGDRAQLLPALADADAVIIRSAPTIEAAALDHAPKLRVVARAGVGLDNVDVEAATRGGVMVVNARRPTSSAPPSTPSRCCSRPRGTCPRPWPR